jgi:hypothetical protein
MGKRNVLLNPWGRRITLQDLCPRFGRRDFSFSFSFFLFLSCFPFLSKALPISVSG